MSLMNNGKSAMTLVLPLSLMTFLMTVIVPRFEPPDAKGEAVEHARVMVFVSVVTVPAPNDSALPVHAVLAPTVIAFALSMMVPTNVVFAASVVAAVGVQNTSHDDAPLAKVTTEFATEVSAPTARKMYVPAPDSVIPAVPMLIAPVLQYTPGLYTPVGCDPTVERLTITPKFSVHGLVARVAKAAAASILACGVGAPGP